MPEPTPQNGMTAELKKLVPGLLLTVAVAFGTSWWNSQLTQNDLRFRLDRLEEKQKDTSAAMAAASQTAQQNAIRLAELGVIQSNIADELRELKQDQIRRR